MRYFLAFIILIGLHQQALMAQKATALYLTDDRGIYRVDLENSATETLIPVTINDVRFIAVDPAGKVYWTDNKTHKIQRANLDGSGVEDLVISGLDKPEGIALDLIANKIYWVDANTAKIQRANLNGSGVEDLITTGLDNPVGLAVDASGGKMYWVDAGTRSAWRANLNGTGVEELVSTGLQTPMGIAVDGTASKIYWTDEGNHIIKRADLDGNNVEELLTVGSDKPQGIALDTVNDKMYWVARSTGAVQRANLDGTGIETLGTYGNERPLGVAVDPTGGKVYWTDWMTNKIMRANLNGSSSQDLVTTSLATVKGIALNLESGQMYWADTGSNKIQRAGLDGGVIEDLVTTNLGHPEGIALDLDDGKMYWTDWGNDNVKRANLDGSNVETLVSTGTTSPEGIALDLTNPSYMFWTDWGLDVIKRSNLNGGGAFNLISGNLTRPQGVAFDPTTEFVYWTDEGKIERSDVNGNSRETLVSSSDLERPARIALDVADGKMYWTDEFANDVWRANLNGTNVERLGLSGFVGLEGLALAFNQVPSSPGITPVEDLEDAQDRLIDLFAAFDDPDHADTELTFTVEGNTSPGLFASTTVNGSNGELRLDYAANANGSATLTIRAEDPLGDYAEEPLVVTLSAVNDAPSFTKGADITVDAGDGSQSFPNWATNISTGPADEAGQSRTFVLSGFDGSLFSVNPTISSAGTLNFTPAAGEDGSTNITVELQDGGGTTNGGQNTSSPSNFTITVNQSPSLGPVSSGIADVSVFEDASNYPIPLFAAFEDPDHNDTALTYEITANSNESLFSNTTIASATGTLTLDFAPDANGTATITVQASDPPGESASATFAVDVTGINDRPSFVKGPDQVVTVGASALYPGWASNISAGPSDEADQDVSFELTPLNTGLFSVPPNVSPDGVLTFTAAEDTLGSTYVRILLRDTGGVENGGINASLLDSFLVTVNPVQFLGPVTSGIGDIDDFEDAPNTTIRLFDAFEDPNDEDSALTFTVEDNSNSALFTSTEIVPSTGDLVLDYAPDAHGSATIVIRAEDPSELYAETSFQVVLSSVNDAPSFLPGPDQVVNNNAGMQEVNPWATSIVAGPSDEQGQSLTFVLNAEVPALFSVAPQVDPSGVLSFSPSPGMEGTSRVSISLQDGGGTANGGVSVSRDTSFTITVNDPNSTAPFPTGIPDLTVAEDACFTEIDLFDAFDDPDDADEDLAYSSEASNPLLLSDSIDEERGVLELDCSKDSNGTSQVTVVARDASGGEGTDTFNVTVLQVNDPPFFVEGNDLEIPPGSGEQVVTGWATDISVGPSDEAWQIPSFQVTPDKPDLFAVAPAIASDGTLTFTTEDNANDTTEVTVILRDDGGTEHGGESESPAATFRIVMTATPSPALQCAISVKPGVRTALLETSVEGFGNNTVVRFEYGLDQSFGMVEIVRPNQNGGSTPASVSARLTGLDPNTTYFFRATASNTWGQASCNPLSFTTESYPADVAVSAEQSFPSYTDTKDFRMVSLPGQAVVDLQDTFEGEAGVDWKAFFDNGQEVNFFEHYNGTPKFRFQPGLGFWVIAKNPWKVEATRVPSVELSPEGTFLVPLHAGWNIVGNPFEHRVAWADVIAANPDLMPAPDSLHAWDSVQGKFDSATMLEPYVGYYFKSPAEGPLHIPYAQNLSSGKASPQATRNRVRTLHDWALGIQLWVGEDERARAWIVQHPASTNGEDAHDHYAPRNDLAGVWLGLLPEGAEANAPAWWVESRPAASDNAVYRLVVGSDGEKRLRLKFEGLSQIAGKEVFLVDRATGRFVDLKTSDFEHQLTGLNGEQHLSLLIGNAFFIEQQRVEMPPPRFQLHQNFPNPFASITQIAFSIPEKAQVRLEVFDVLGREVRLLVDQEHLPGVHTFEWDGRSNTGQRVANGIYFYRLIASNFVEVQQLIKLD